ncbi:MAG: 50S ribosomal protein L29 [Candidatus Micrarchaeia archaeon]
MRKLHPNELSQKLDDLVLQLATEKSKVASTGVSSKTIKIRDIKKTIARIKTIQNSQKKGAHS